MNGGHWQLDHRFTSECLDHRQLHRQNAERRSKLFSLIVGLRVDTVNRRSSFGQEALDAMAAAAEAKVLQLLTDQNKPFNAQVVADFLATHGVKKTACQKALDALTEQGKIVCKVRWQKSACVLMLVHHTAADCQPCSCMAHGGC
jgi:ornithine carbamoyltransferase